MAMVIGDGENGSLPPSPITVAFTRQKTLATLCERRSFVPDEGRPLAIGRQGQIANRLELRRLRAVVVNVKLKGAAMIASDMVHEGERK